MLRDESDVHNDGSNAIFMPIDKIRTIPLFESCSAGFGAYADSTVIGYELAYIDSDWEAENTIAVKVKGDSMYHKIEDGDIVLVCKDMNYEDGDIVVARVEEDEAFVKRIRLYPNKIILESINPEYTDRVFVKEEMNSIHIEGTVTKIIRKTR